MEREDQIPEDDWTDQDILTRGEAGERLDDEIEAVTRELAALRPDSNGPREVAERLLLTRRLDAMRAARAGLRGR
jgi:hypothetical protein